MSDNSLEFVEFVAKQIRTQIDILLSDYAGDATLIVDNEFDNATDEQQFLAAARPYAYNHLIDTWIADVPRCNEERLHGAAKAAIKAVREWDATHAPESWPPFEIA